MNQPDLGKKISELRRAKGLTQGELAEQCKLSLRTIQRIESAEVTPRSYTVKLIFKCLDYEIYNSFGRLSYKLDRMAYRLKTWSGPVCRYTLDLFNLKTNTMKKITILSLPFLSIVLVLFFTGLNTKAQSHDEVKANLKELNAKFIDWFNSGEFDSIGSIYLDNACMIPDNYHEIHGRQDIKDYFRFLYETGFRFAEIESRVIIISDSIAVDRGIWKADLIHPLTGTYLMQWRLSDGNWFIENDMSNSDVY